jgi:hypothetical protein
MSPPAAKCRWRGRKLLAHEWIVGTLAVPVAPQLEPPGVDRRGKIVAPIAAVQGRQ